MEVAHRGAFFVIRCLSCCYIQIFCKNTQIETKKGVFFWGRKDNFLHYQFLFLFKF